MKRQTEGQAGTLDLHDRIGQSILAMKLKLKTMNSTEIDLTISSGLWHPIENMDATGTHGAAASMKFALARCRGILIYSIGNALLDGLFEAGGLGRFVYVSFCADRTPCDVV